MDLKDKRVLVTGSRGFIGRRLAARLEKQGVQVMTLNMDNIRIDVRDWQRVKDIENIDNLDLVYHLAARTYTPASFEDPKETYEVNVLGTLNILELCRLHDIEKIVFTSSYVYGTPKYLPVDEKHPVNPGNPYSRSKALAEDFCRAYHEDYGIKCVILRLFNIYGEGQNENFLIPSILNQLATGKVELDDSRPKRDLLYIDDVVDAYLKTGGYASDFDIFNIGYGKSYSVDEIVKKIIRLYKKDVEVTYLNKERKNDILDVVADIHKAKRDLKWSPKVGIDEGLRMVLSLENLSNQSLE